MPESGTGATIQHTLDYVGQVYEETALLMKDLAAALKKRQFRSLLGNSNGSTGSKQLDWPRQWLPRYVSGYWVLEGAPAKGRKATYVAASVLLADLNDRAIEPLLVYGVVRGMDHEKASYQYSWLLDIHFNKDKAFRKAVEDGDQVRFECVKYGQDSYAWADSGIVLTRPLISVTNRAELDAVAEKMATLWTSETAGT